ncbi:MAG: ABC transporter ATP-binding protein [Lachnospiraceae bacterium]|nr:ABC transporter ATP-binding protein [Lachnospiraceae bacterium]
MIRAEHLTMIYGKDFKAVEDLSFSIGKGEIVGFAGPNGAGKTTVIKMLTGILRPAEGRALINGFDIQKEPLKAKASFAYVADNPDVLLQLKGVEYINFIADIYKVPDEERKARVPELAERFGILDALDTPMREYSHGMRQKLMVIAALTHNPPAWILDEPMTGLDPSAAYELKQMMREHAAKGNCVLFSTHVLEVAEKLCDHILIMNHGHSLYQGTVDELSAAHPGKDLEEIFLSMIDHRSTQEEEK